LDAADAGIVAVVWATGFRYNFDWVKVPVLGSSGEPQQQRGVSPLPGFYFLGLRRMFNLRSNLFEGVGEDAAYIAEHISARVCLGGPNPTAPNTSATALAAMDLLLSCGF
jgi:putative flavoprotein involved in K+ transport